MSARPIVLVPGFWLGAWAWDEVAAALRADGHDVTALTLPGLESADADRSQVTLADHVDAICDAVHGGGASRRARRAQRDRVLGLRRERPYPGADRRDGLRRLRPRKGAIDPDFEGAEMPMNWESIEEEENLDGLSEEQKETFRQRAVPEPGAILREGAELKNDARLDIPSTIICTGFTSEQYKEAMKEGHAFLAGLPELRNVTWIDLPTSHWPMWSRPQETAAIIGDVARGA